MASQTNNSRVGTGSLPKTHVAGSHDKHTKPIPEMTFIPGQMSCTFHLLDVADIRNVTGSWMWCHSKYVIKLLT